MEDKPQSLFFNGSPYRVISLLGHGKGGYSYLVKKDEDLFVLKKIHHEPCAYYSFGDKLSSEINDYKRLLLVPVKMPKIYEVDKDNEMILKEYVEGKTALMMLLDGEMKEGHLNKMKQLEAKLKEDGLNIDYFPTNFICRDNEFVYVDYEANEYDEKWDFTHWGILYWSKTPQLDKYLRQEKEKTGS